jgi:hypothetical protein
MTETIDYQIAIPTYRRADAIRKYTLKYLESTDVDKERVTLFVSDKADAKKYESSNPGYKIVVAEGAKSLAEKRLFISEHYERGTRVISFDDDVSAVCQLALGKPLTENQKPLDHPCSLQPVDSLHGFIQRGFRLAETFEVDIWGCYQVSNKGFLHPRIGVGLKFIMGHFFGFYAGDEVFKRIKQYPGKDDVYWSVWHFANRNGTLRFDDHCVKSKAHSGSGGTCDDMEKKLLLNNESVERIVQEFPELASIKMRKTKDEWLSRYKEVRLKSVTTSSVSTLQLLNAPFIEWADPGV